jgi:FtsP/CotA-like multicopper oxidase with cupredoxin domain
MRALSLTTAAVVALMLFAPGSFVRAASLAAIPEFTPDVDGVTTVTLTVDAVRIDIPGAVSFTTRAYHWNGVPQFPGPTLVLKAGGKLRLTLVNNLEDDSALDATKAANTFRHANTTNVHTHGLHVDPAIDSIFRHASPAGGTVEYDLPIPESHAPGMHWYHSHSHGSSTMHIMGGLVGAMYVDWQERDNIPAALQALTHHRLVMQMLNFAPETANNGGVFQSCYPAQPYFNPFKTYSFSQLEEESGSLLFSNPTYETDQRFFYLINGQYVPTVTMNPGESRLFQLVYAAGSKNPALIFPSGCTAQNIAFDGVYFNGAPRTVTFLQLIVASRVEFVLTCASAGTHAVTYMINGDINNPRTTGGSPLFYINAAGGTVASATLPATLASITRPSYLSDLQGSGVTIDTTHTVTLNQGGHPDCQFILGQGTDCAFTPGGPPASQTKCQSEVFRGQRGLDAADHVYTMKVGQTAEWTLYGAGNTPHPLHIHVNHYQIQSYSGTDAVLNHWVHAGDWRDTIPVLDGTLKIRFVADEIHGETVMHCHELSHEDRGLMATFLIEPADATTPGDSDTEAPLSPAETPEDDTPSDEDGTGGNTTHSSAAAGSSALNFAAVFALAASVLAVVA